MNSTIMVADNLRILIYQEVFHFADYVDFGLERFRQSIYKLSLQLWAFLSNDNKILSKFNKTIENIFKLSSVILLT